MIILFSYHSFSLRYLKLFSHGIIFPGFLNISLGKYRQLPAISLCINSDENVDFLGS